MILLQPTFKDENQKELVYECPLCETTFDQKKSASDKLTHDLFGCKKYTFCPNCNLDAKDYKNVSWTKRVDLWAKAIALLSEDLPLDW